MTRRKTHDLRPMRCFWLGTSNQKNGDDLNLNSLRTARIETYVLETQAFLTSGTCWFGQKGGRTYLISNYHVLKGRLVANDKPHHPSAGLPGMYKVHCWLTKPISTTANGERQLQTMGMTMKLMTDDVVILWNETLRSDVAAIDISDQLKDRSAGYDLETWDLDSLSSPQKPLEVTNDLFIVGFPQTELSRSTNSPIYKSATIASEPETTHSAGYFLADGKTKSGMSGSPVLVKDGLSGQPSATGFQLKMGDPHLIGVYSGRDENDPDLYTAELGKVWHLKETLLDILP
ncbi:MAG: trypsin-like peptidase domain-containing protein [Paracoccaceae bacterium]